jgi:hypothetical protein
VARMGEAYADLLLIMIVPMEGRRPPVKSPDASADSSQTSQSADMGARPAVTVIYFQSPGNWGPSSPPASSCCARLLVTTADGFIDEVLAHRRRTSPLQSARIRVPGRQLRLLHAGAPP